MNARAILSLIYTAEGNRLRPCRSDSSMNRGCQNDVPKIGVAGRIMVVLLAELRL